MSPCTAHIDAVVQQLVVFAVWRMMPTNFWVQNAYISVPLQFMLFHWWIVVYNLAENTASRRVLFAWIFDEPQLSKCVVSFSLFTTLLRAGFRQWETLYAIRFLFFTRNHQFWITNFDENWTTKLLSKKWYTTFIRTHPHLVRHPPSNFFHSHKCVPLHGLKSTDL